VWLQPAGAAAGPTFSPRSMNFTATCSFVAFTLASCTKPKVPLFKSRICISLARSLRPNCMPSEHRGLHLFVFVVLVQWFLSCRVHLDYVDSN
jgi:hypothetical protein